MQLSAGAPSLYHLLQEWRSDDHDIRSLGVTDVLGQPGVAYADVGRLTDQVIAVVAGLVLHEAEPPVGAKEGLDGVNRVNTPTREPEPAADRLLPRQCTY